MKTTTATVRIRLDQAVEVNKRDLNLSLFLREKLDEEFGSNDFIAAKEKELKEELKKLKQIKKESQSKEKESNTEKEKFFREARVKIKENPNFLMGQWERYKNLFEKISLEKFKEMIK